MISTGCPSLAVRFTTIPPPTRCSLRPSAVVNSSTLRRTSRAPVAAAVRPSTSISTSTPPALARIAPSGIRSKCAVVSTSRLPVAVMNTSPIHRGQDGHQYVHPELLAGVHVRLYVFVTSKVSAPHLVGQVGQEEITHETADAPEG